VNHHSFMRHAVLVMLSFSMSVGAQPSSRPSRSPEIAAVKAQEEAFRQAELNYDVASARAILADEFVGTWNHGEQVNKDQFLTLIGDKADRSKCLNMVIWKFGSMAILLWSGRRFTKRPCTAGRLTSTEAAGQRCG
jgi:hypothetical protein